MKTAFETASNERADIAINIFPDFHGVTELLVYHKIKRKLFSKEIKENCFVLCITKYESPNDAHALYEYKTTDFNEVMCVFSELITNRILPELKRWQRIL